MHPHKQLQQHFTAQDPTLEKKWNHYIAEASEKNIPLPDYLLKLGTFDEVELKKAVTEAYKLQFVETLPNRLKKMTSRYIPVAFAEAQRVVVFYETDTEVHVAFADPDKVEIQDAIKKKIPKKVTFFFAFSYEIEQSLKDVQSNLDDKFQNLKIGALKDLSSIESLKNSSKLLDIILTSSLEYKASDIHIEPHEDRIIIRFRVDGLLRDIIDLPTELAVIISSRIKVLAGLRTDEHQKPQDGRFKLTLPDGNEITTRTSILPVYEGEKIVMRILSANKQKIELKDLGYTDKNQSMIYENINKAHGMVLVTGPTGSGKTTTLYTVLKLLNKPKVNLMTVEDPIEYRLDRVNQVQINTAAGLSFADGLRSILRQDPDVIMIGEIRDEETATIAINASLTGHLVLATLHTNSAIETIPRLLEMNIEPYLVASTVNVIIAQRLVRKLCSCKKAVPFNNKILQSLKLEESDFTTELMNYCESYLPENTPIYEPQGCKECNNSGFAGRLAIAEVINVSDQIKDMIYEKKPSTEIEKIAREQGFKNLLEDAVVKVKNGETSLAEIIRVLKV